MAHRGMSAMRRSMVISTVPYGYEIKKTVKKWFIHFFAAFSSFNQRRAD
jgi:hypothetical protein